MVSTGASAEYVGWMRFPTGVLTGEVPPLQGPVDDDHLDRMSACPREPKRPSAEHRDARAPGSRTGSTVADRGLGLRRRRGGLVRAEEALGAAVSGAGQDVHPRHGRHAGDGGHRLEHPGVQGMSTLVLLHHALGSDHRHPERALGTEARVDREHAEQALPHQARRAEQHHRQRHLDRHQRAAKSVAVWIRRGRVRCRP